MTPSKAFTSKAYGRSNRPPARRLKVMFQGFQGGFLRIPGLFRAFGALGITSAAAEGDGVELLFLRVYLFFPLLDAGKQRPARHAAAVWQDGELLALGYHFRAVRHSKRSQMQLTTAKRS
eukprot:905931-Prorocentrum_minimum.AAC.5